MKGHTYQYDLYSTNDVHSGGQRGTRVEQHPHRPAELRPQRARDHEVASARRHHPVSGDGGHGDSGQHGWAATRQDDEEAEDGASCAHDPGETDEQDDAEDVLDAGQEDTDERAHSRGGRCGRFVRVPCDGDGVGVVCQRAEKRGDARPVLHLLLRRAIQTKHIR